MAILSHEQIEALRTAPIGRQPNRLQVAFALADAKQTDACDVTGLSAPTLSKLVRGSYQTLDIENARKLAEFFGCSIEDLFPARAEVA